MRESTIYLHTQRSACGWQYMTHLPEQMELPVYYTPDPSGETCVKKVIPEGLEPSTH